MIILLEYGVNSGRNWIAYSFRRQSARNIKISPVSSQKPRSHPFPH